MVHYTDIIGRCVSECDFALFLVCSLYAKIKKGLLDAKPIILVTSGPIVEVV